MRVCRIADFIVASPLLSRLARDRVGAASKIKCPTAGGTGTSSTCGKYQGVWHRDTVSCFHTSSSLSFVSCSSTSSVSSSHPPSPAVLIPCIFYCSSSCLSFSCSLPHSFVFRLPFNPTFYPLLLIFPTFSSPSHISTCPLHFHIWPAYNNATATTKATAAVILTHIPSSLIIIFFIFSIWYAVSS